MLRLKLWILWNVTQYFFKNFINCIFSYQMFLPNSLKCTDLFHSMKNLQFDLYMDPLFGLRIDSGTLRSISHEHKVTLSINEYRTLCKVNAVLFLSTWWCSRWFWHQFMICSHCHTIYLWTFFHSHQLWCPTDDWIFKS